MNQLKTTAGATTIANPAPHPTIQRRGRVLIVNTRSTLYDIRDDSSSLPSTVQATPSLDATNASSSTLPKYQHIRPHKTELIEPYLNNNKDDFQHVSLPTFQVVNLKLLRHGVDIGPAEWVEVARIIRDRYNEFDGFVVIHGTDGMAYTSSALSFMLKNLGKPVIFTGAIVTINQIHTEIKRNVVLAMQLAVTRKLTEVCILFAERLFRANRTIKVARRRLQPFATPNFPPLATVQGKTVRLMEENLLPPVPTGRLLVHTHMQAKVVTITVTPGSFFLTIKGLHQRLVNDVHSPFLIDPKTEHHVQKGVAGAASPPQPSPSEINKSSVLQQPLLSHSPNVNLKETVVVASSPDDEDEFEEGWRSEEAPFYSENDVRAIVLAGFGAGNLPVDGAVENPNKEPTAEEREHLYILGLLQQLSKKFVVVLCTQNVYGRVSSDYSLGRQLGAYGVVPAGDMTLETTIVKLKFLFGCGFQNEKVRREMQKSLRGELTTVPQAVSHL